MGSIKKKLKTILEDGALVMAAYEEGKRNFQANIPEVEELAKKRIKLSSAFIQPEPISFLRVEDERVPAASNMMFSDCGCTAAYKIRQSVILRPEWNEE